METVKMMNEEDIRQYFVQNGGMVRNTDIVNYFRSFLSNPTTRDEARVIFKTYVNKLATVKVENGEKFLVLKRQYFPPIDGNGNPRIAASSTSSAASYPLGGYAGGALSGSGLPGLSQNTNPQMYYSQQISGLPNVPNNANYHRRQNSQTQLYGSQYSLNSNYMDPYGNNNNPQYSATTSPPTANFYPASHYTQQASSGNGSRTHLPLQNINMQQQNIYGNVADYPSEYGLPPVPNGGPVMSPPRRFVSPQNSFGSSSGGGSPLSRIPPPYRPPPPAGRFSSSPSSNSISRRSSMTSVSGIPYNRTQSVPGQGGASFYSTSSTQNVNALMDPNTPGMFQYHRSASVTGLPSAVNNSVPFPPGEHSKYFDAISAAPPPPVPPRSRRSVERSPSAVNYSSSSSSSGGTHSGLAHRNRLKMETERANGDNFNPATAIQPQHLQSINGASGSPIQDQMENGMMDSEQEKENINAQTDDGFNHVQVDGKEFGGSELEQKISVKERMQKFNRMASEGELTSASGGLNANNKAPSSRNRSRDISTKHESGEFDTASLSSLDPKSKEWMMKAMKCDYPVLNKMAQENPALVRRRDMNTALHWSSKHGNVECVKLLAGTYKAEVNIKTNGGYTPLHLAAQFGRQDVYDILIKTYNADANIRDHSGKKPMQYLVRQDASLSMDSFKKLKEKRRHTEQKERDSGFLRIGSLNVKVKSTRDAFGHLLGKSSSSSRMEKVQKHHWGSADNLPEDDEGEKDKHLMPPPLGLPTRPVHKQSKRRHKRTADSAMKDSKSDSDSDSAFGFGSEWSSPVRE